MLIASQRPSPFPFPCHALAIPHQSTGHTATPALSHARHRLHQRGKAPCLSTAIEDIHAAATGPAFKVKPTHYGHIRPPPATAAATPCRPRTTCGTRVPLPSCPPIENVPIKSSMFGTRKSPNRPKGFPGPSLAALPGPRALLSLRLSPRDSPLDLDPAKRSPCAWPGHPSLRFDAPRCAAERLAPCDIRSFACATRVTPPPPPSAPIAVPTAPCSRTPGRLCATACTHRASPCPAPRRRSAAARADSTAPRTPSDAALPHTAPDSNPNAL